MSSGLFVDYTGTEDGRRRHEVLTDFRFNELIKDQIGHDFSSKEGLIEGLSDDKIYFVERDYYHTLSNIDPSNAYKVGAGPAGKGKAGDLDVGMIDIPNGKITKIELKAPGKIPPLEEREDLDKSYESVRKAHRQNKYLAELLENIENSESVEIPYSSRVEVWNDVIRDETIVLDDLTNYSSHGTYLCTPEAERRARESEKIQMLDEALFKNWMLGGGESILEDIDEILEE